jgi:digeranylgeranylglycerophospholipid reductase
MQPQYDVIVIGAGPAGSVAARRAAEAGLSVLLLEKRQEIGAPVRCAEAIGVESLHPFMELDERWVDAHIDKYAIYNSKGLHMAAPPAEPTVVVNRKVFDLELARRAAQAGAEVMASTAAVGLLKDGSRVCGVRVERFGEPHEIAARLVVAADGVESTVARWAGLKTTAPMGDYYTAAQFLVAGVGSQLTAGQCEYHLDHTIAPGGYGWVFPKGADTANVGLVIAADQAAGLSVRAQLERLVEKRFGRVSVLAVVAGAIPVTGAIKHMVADGLVVVGDAAHQADPLTAGGINLGMMGADFAMQAAIPALKTGVPTAARLAVYERLWHDRFGRMHEALYKMRKILSHLEQKRLDGLVATAASLPLEQMSLGQVLAAVLKHDPLLLLEASRLITTGLILK